MAYSQAVWTSLVFRSPQPWRGLTLEAVILEAGIESGPYNFSLVFAEAPAKAHDILRSLGFEPPNPGERRTVGDNEVVEAGMFLGPYGTGSILTCYSD